MHTQADKLRVRVFFQVEELNLTDPSEDLVSFHPTAGKPFN
jgi:hypothetical protein